LLVIGIAITKPSCSRVVWEGKGSICVFISKPKAWSRQTISFSEWFASPFCGACAAKKPEAKRAIGGSKGSYRFARLAAGCMASQPLKFGLKRLNAFSMEKSSTIPGLEKKSKSFFIPP